MRDNKAELHELHVIPGITGLWTDDVHISPKVLQLLFDVVNKARVAVRKFNAAPAEGAFTDPIVVDARAAKEEYKHALEGLAAAIWEEAKKLVETA